MSFFTPFAFVQTITTGGGGTNVPPYNPVLYYDASNTTVGNATDLAINVVTTSSNNSNTGSVSANGPVDYTSGQYWQFNYPDRLVLDNSNTSSFLNSMGANEHTIVIRTFTTDSDEDDFIGNFTEGGIMSMFFENKLRAHIINQGNVIVTDSANSVTLDTQIFVGQRLKNVGGGNGQIDVFLADNITSAMTKTDGTPTAVTFGGVGSSVLQTFGAGGRSQGITSGRLYKIAIYDTALTNTEIEDVREFMS
jgi:hypothetical protein